MSDYMEKIAIFVILQEIITGVIINEEYKKMIKIVMGIMMIIIVINPIIRFMNMEEKFELEEKLVTDETKQEEKLKENTIKMYERHIKNALENHIGESGYKILEVKVEILNDELKEIEIVTDKNIKADNPVYEKIKNYLIKNVGVENEKIVIGW